MITAITEDKLLYGSYLRTVFVTYTFHSLFITSCSTFLLIKAFIKKVFLSMSHSLHTAYAHHFECFFKIPQKLTAISEQQIQNKSFFRNNCYLRTINRHSMKVPFEISVISEQQIQKEGGWSAGAMVLGKLPVPGSPTIWIIVGQGPIVLAVGVGEGCLDIFTLLYLFSPLSPSLWETARYRLKYCLKEPLNPKSTKQLTERRFLLK